MICCHESLTSGQLTKEDTEEMIRSYYKCFGSSEGILDLKTVVLSSLGRESCGLNMIWSRFRRQCVEIFKLGKIS